MDKKVIFYYNPNAGNKFIVSKLDYIIDEFQKKGDVLTLYRAKKNENLFKLFTKERLEGYSKIVIAGGDGTVNQVVAALIKNDIDLPLSILPAGTANDYAYTLNIPSKIEEMVKIAAANKYKSVDIVSLNKKYFVNVFAIGNIVTISQSTDKNIKKTLGPLAYYLNGFSKLSTIKPFELEIKSKEKSFKGKVIFALFLNGKSAGGFNKLAPLASLEDGLIDVIIFKDMPFFEFPNAFTSVLIGKITENKNVVTWQTSELEVSSKEKVPTDIDGEIGEPLPAKLTVLKERLKIATGK